MKKIGIWLDKNKAVIIQLEKENEQMVTIPSNIEHFRIRGGSGTRFKGGPQDVVQDSRYLEREKHQFQVFFKNILEKITDVDRLVLFGPAQAKDKFKKMLETDHPSYHNLLSDVVTADSMTDNQLKAWVRKYYK